MKNAYIKMTLLYLITFLSIIVLLLTILHIKDAKISTARAVANSEHHNDVTSTFLKDKIVKLPQDPMASEKNKASDIPAVSPENLPLNKMTWSVLRDTNVLKNVPVLDKISFNEASKYSDLEGVTCFRGNNYRNSAAFGTVSLSEEKLQKVWSVVIGGIDTWTGVGWNGQPAIVKWSDDLKSKMNILPSKKSKPNLKEVIYATLDGNIYFLDLDNGEATRKMLTIGFPLKGSVSVDPRGIPLLYSGQGIDEIIDDDFQDTSDKSTDKGNTTPTFEKKLKKVEIGYRIFSLMDFKQLYFINGYDTKAFRWWGAFDSTGIIDRNSDTLIVCGENGIFYRIKLNTVFDKNSGRISISPDPYKYRYSYPKKSTTGTENSVAIYKNLAFFADNGGVLQCLDMNTLTPVWVRDVIDDTDSTIALEESEDGNVSLYTACEVDIQKDDGKSYIRKINALTGSLLWEKSYTCNYDSDTNGGVLASPVVGKKDISNLVIYNISKTVGSKAGKLIAFDKKTGNEQWVLNLDNYCWSSPVDVYTESGKSYIIVCDSAGNMFLIEGRTGRVIDKINLGANIEGSPAVYDDMIVVGTRGQKIWGVKIK